MTTNNDGNSVSQTPERNPVQHPGQNPEKKRFSRRTLGYAGVGVLTAAVVSRCTGLIKTPEELEEERKKKQEAEERERQAQKDRALAVLEPDQAFVEATKVSDFEGPLVYTAYERNGEFVPATEEHPAQNVPYPVPQPEMYEYSLQGFHTFMGYFARPSTTYITREIPSPCRRLLSRRLSFLKQFFACTERNVDGLYRKMMCVRRGFLSR